MTPREERFLHLYERAHPRIVTYAVRRTPNAEDAADVVAETFAIAWRRLEAVPQGEREAAWLYAVARNVIANRVRKASSSATIVRRLARDLAASASSPDEVEGERVEALNALHQLSEEDREILMLVAWDGLTSRQLAWVLGCSPTAARIRLHRARSRLTAAWTDVQSDPVDPLPLPQEVPEP